MKNMIGTVVTVITVMGEIVGRLIELNTAGAVLRDPRLFVQIDAERAGFIPGIGTTGEVDVSEITIRQYICILPSNKASENAWMKATSGIVLQ